MKTPMKKTDATSKTPKMESPTDINKMIEEYESARAEHAMKAQKSEKDERYINECLIPAYQARMASEIEEVRERFLYIIEAAASDKYRYEWLENHTGIPATRWQNVLFEKQLPTLDMIMAAICHLRPGYTFWLFHGHLPNENGLAISEIQTAPPKDAFNEFRAIRELVKSKKKSKAAAKK